MHLHPHDTYLLKKKKIKLNTCLCCPDTLFIILAKRSELDPRLVCLSHQQRASQLWLHTDHPKDSKTPTALATFQHLQDWSPNKGICKTPWVISVCSPGRKPEHCVNTSVKGSVLPTPKGTFPFPHPSAEGPAPSLVAGRSLNKCEKASAEDSSLSKESKFRKRRKPIWLGNSRETSQKNGKVSGTWSTGKLLVVHDKEEQSTHCRNCEPRMNGGIGRWSTWQWRWPHLWKEHSEIQRSYFI